MTENMIDVLSLHSGTAFKHAFSQPNIFREFVRDVTGIDINPEIIYTEYEYPQQIGNVNIKYDIFAEDDKERVIVEIQHIKEEDFFARFLYYHLIGIIEQVAKHDAYEPPKRVITIVVLASVPRDGSISFSWGRHLMEILDEHSKRHQIAPHELIFLNPRLVNESTPELAKPWLELIKDSDVSTAMKDETAWEMASRRFHQEGIEEGLEIGIEQGIAQGREEGIEQGIEQGRREQQVETARVMLAEGIEHSIIALATGLTVGEIESLVSGEEP